MMIIGKYFIRMMVVIFWIAIMYAFLMIPKLFETTTPENALRIYTWANRIDESLIRQFEKETGIKIYLSYYESSEELLTKLEKMSSVDCDIMLPSGYIIEPMIKHGLIKRLDHTYSKLLLDVYPQFKGQYFDPENQYSIPLYWDVFGIGYNAKVLSYQSVTLDLLFNQDKIIGREIGMTEDARESIFLAAQYLGFNLYQPLTFEQLGQIQDLLKLQKPWVGSYSDSNQGYFLASDTFAVVVSDREIIARQMQKHDFIKFSLIPEGSMLRIDSIVINAATQKDDMIYQFIKFLLDKKTMLHHAQKYCILPTTKSAFQALDQKYIGIPHLYPGSENFNKLVMFRHGLTQKILNDFWIRFKAS